MDWRQVVTAIGYSVWSVYERKPTKEHAIVQRIAHRRLECALPSCPYGRRIDPGETYEWDVRLGGGWDRCYHLDCHRRAIHKPEPREPEFRPGPPFEKDTMKE